MGILDGLMALAKDTPAGLVTSTVSTILDRVLPEDPAAREAAAIKLLELQNAGTFDQRADLQLAAGQIDVNKAAAAAGGAHFRDGAGWVCVFGFGVTVLRPMVEWGFVIAGHPLTLPAMDMTEIGPMLAALLGLGGFHAAERIKAAA